jgi:hypothetical protein
MRSLPVGLRVDIERCRPWPHVAMMALALTVCTVTIRLARAAERPKIVLLQSVGAPSALGRRLQAELTSMGISVVEASDGDSPSGAKMLVDIAARENAFAAVRVVSEGNLVTVWVADRLTNKTLVRTLTSTANVGAEVVALQVIELLRASLLELNLSEPNAPSRSSSPPELTALLRPTTSPPIAARSPRIHLDVSGVMLGGPGGVSPTGHASIGLRYSFDLRWSSRIFIVLPVVAGTARGPEGRAETGVALAGATLELRLTSPSSEWSFFSGVALAGAMIRTVGTSESALLERTDSVYAAVPAVIATAQRQLSGRASLGVQALGGVSLPRPVIVFGERETAYWGRPLLGGSVVFALGLD